MRRILLRGLLTAPLLLLSIATASAQGDFAVTDTNAPPPTPLPTGMILIPGAISRSSDSRTALPENGAIVRDVYQNVYFGLTYTLPQDWVQEFNGPPPSDMGRYVLAELSPSKSFKGPSRGSLLITAQDLFFSPGSAHTAAEMVRDSVDHLPSYYKLESPPEDLTIANHRVTRFDYMSPEAGLHWRVLATEVRCHAVQFVLTSADTHDRRWTEGLCVSRGGRFRSWRRRHAGLRPELCGPGEHRIPSRTRHDDAQGGVDACPHYHRQVGQGAARPRHQCVRRNGVDHH
jgi:hypothetical protein